ncbi:MAG: ASCH domain-containing protein [Chloroflexi bacterium]|nr:ASCH domain-containing protein [Chloroflexota bacterium]
MSFDNYDPDYDDPDYDEWDDDDYDPVVDAFWERYLASLPPEAPQPESYSAWGFGDSPEMADELGALVYEGVKTATCGLLYEYEAEGEPIPQVGDLSVITSGDGAPLCIIETTEVNVQPFNTVDAQFAYDEGEGDRSYENWRQGHLRFFTRACKELGCTFDESMPVVAERFRVVYRE